MRRTVRSKPQLPPSVVDKIRQLFINHLGFLTNPYKSKYIKYALVFAIWTLFFTRSYFYLDPDFGWHIRMGQIIQSQGIPATDPLSYTMPSFPFVDHEWLTNLGIAFIHSYAGMTGLAAVYATVITTTLLIAIAPKRLDWILFIPLLLATATVYAYSGIRPQTETWLLVAILIKLLYSINLWQRWRFTVPLLFVLWANLHGGFAIGVGILFLGIFTKAISERSDIRINAIVGLSSLLATLINPYGLNLWNEVWMQFTDPGLRETIREWMPIYHNFSLASNLALITLVSLAIYSVISLRKQLTLTHLALFAILFVAGIYSRRHLPIWIIASLPILYLGTINLIRLKKIPTNTSPRAALPNLFLLICLATSVVQLSITSPLTYNYLENFYYPVQSLNFLEKTNLQGRLFTDYNWGGYLSWKRPGERVFIDGRMPSWRWQSPKTDESNWAIKEYKELIEGEGDPNIILDKYQVGAILLPTKTFAGTEMFGNGTAKMSSTSQTNNLFIKRLEDNGWKKAYVDVISVVYIKTN